MKGCQISVCEQEWEEVALAILYSSFKSSWKNLFAWRTKNNPIYMAGSYQL